MKFIKGLNKDASPVDQPEGTYRYAKNILFNETAGAISNEPGNISVNSSIAIGHRVIGSIEITDDRVVLFTTDNSNTHNVYIYNPSNNDSVDLILTTSPGNSPANIDFSLKFSWDYPIEGVYKIDPDGNLIVYWTDNNNPPRSLNVTRQLTSNNAQIYNIDPFTSPNTNYIDRLNLFPHAGPVPKIAFARIANGGALKSGTYYLFLAYVDKNSTQTNYVSYSLAVPIVEDDESVRPIERYDGCEPDTQTGKSIVWEVSNLNTDYEFLRPIVVHRTLDEDSAPAEFAFKLNDIDINSNSGTIVFSGLEGYSSTSVEDAIIDTVAYDTVKTLTQLDSILYLGNLTGSRDIGYQKYANFIKLNALVSPPFEPFDAYELSSDNLEFGYLDTTPDPTIRKDQGFRDVNNISSSNNYKGYTRDEVYAFYIAFILNDGSMSYAYHIPGRSSLTGLTSESVRKIGNLGNAGSNAIEQNVGATVNELQTIVGVDPDLAAASNDQGQAFHFYDFSIFGNRNTNFWHNQNEFYPSTDDYEMIDANNPAVVVEDLRGSNVRHHHMPCNTNSGMRSIVSNTGNFQPDTDSQTFTYYFAAGAEDSSGANHLENTNGGGNTQSNLGILQSELTSDIITDFNDATWDAIIAGLEGIYGDTSTWVYQVPNQSHIEGGASQANGHWAWTYGSGAFFQFEGASQNVTINSIDATYIDIDQGSDYHPDTPPFVGDGNGNIANSVGEVNYSIFVWSETIPAITQNGVLSQEVQALGVQFDDIKIPKSIADKVQGFRIYYAERDHTNRRILGQDAIKNTRQIDDINISGCTTDSPGNTVSEDFILAPGTLYGGTINTATFHDFYLLRTRNSLVPATHTSLEYRVDMLSFLGPGHQYADVDNDLGDCIFRDTYPSLHMGQTYLPLTTQDLSFYNFPLREKCKTYMNGDSIFDARGIGFGKRIYNIGGESSILLAFKPTREPAAPNFDDAATGAGWHAVPPLGAGFSYPLVDDEVQLHIHNLHAFKTDMYLSYDTQELAWTGFEVLGDELDNYTVEDNNVSTPGATHSTGDIFGGDTFICRHGYRMTHRPEHETASPRDHKALIYLISESTDNINFRHETSVSTAYFPGSPAKKLLDLKAEEDLTKKDNVKYDESFSLGIADIKPAIPYPLRESDPSIFKTRVQRSAKADNSSLIDNYRVHLAFQFKDLPRNRGDLWKLISLNNLLYLHTEDSLFRTKGKQSLKLSDGTESFVGSGDIFAQEPDEVIQTKYGYGGTQSQWVSMVTKHGYFSLDYRNRRVFMFKDTMYDISRAGLESWFQDNIPFELEAYGLQSSDWDNPIVGIGFHAMYDERYDRIVLTKKDFKPTKTFINEYNLGNITYDSRLQSFMYATSALSFDNLQYFTKSGWTVSYDVELNVWVSFHDYVPYKYTRSADELVSFTEGSTGIWVHNNELNRGSFYGTDYTSEFEFIYNLAKDSDKTFYSFEYMVDVYNSSNSLIHDQGFSSFYIYNTHQISGELDVEYMINTRRIGNAWKINKFRDMASLVNTPVAAGTGSNFGVTGASVAGTNISSTVTSSTGQAMFSFDGMTETINSNFINLGKSWDKQRKFSDKWLGIRLKYNNITKKLINLYTTDVAAKKFYR